MANAKHLIIAQMILAETGNSIIKTAVKKAAKADIKDDVRFGVVVMEMMPEPESDDGFFFVAEESKESEARTELSKILNRINQETSFELDVKADQEIVIRANLIVAREAGKISKYHFTVIMNELKKAIDNDYISLAPFRFVETGTDQGFCMTNRDDYDILVSSDGEIM